MNIAALSLPIPTPAPARRPSESAAQPFDKAMPSGPAAATTVPAHVKSGSPKLAATQKPEAAEDVTTRPEVRDDINDAATQCETPDDVVSAAMAAIPTHESTSPGVGTLEDRKIPVRENAGGDIVNEGTPKSNPLSGNPSRTTSEGTQVRNGIPADLPEPAQANFVAALAAGANRAAPTTSQHPSSIPANQAAINAVAANPAALTAAINLSGEIGLNRPGQSGQVQVSEFRPGMISRPSNALAPVPLTAGTTHGDTPTAVSESIPDDQSISDFRGRDQAKMTAAASEEAEVAEAQDSNQNEATGKTQMLASRNNGLPGADPAQQRNQPSLQQLGASLPAPAVQSAAAAINSDATSVDILFDPAVADTRDTIRPSLPTMAAAIVRQTAAHSMPTDQVAVHILKGIDSGTDRIQIRLHPASLGRVDVELNIGHDGRINAVIAADRPATLDLLQRDVQQLAKALQDAGLQADSDSLSFNLRDSSGGQSRFFADAQPAKRVDGDEFGPLEATDETAPATYASAANGRVDIRV